MSGLLELLMPIGNLLIAQLLFFCCSLTVVLMVPAAVALQQTVQAILTDQENAVTRTFVSKLRPAIRRFWLIGLAVDVLIVVVAVSLFFWASVQSPIAVVGLVALAVVSGLLLGGYLCLLAESTRRTTTTTRELLSAAGRRMQSQPLLTGGGVVIMITWFLLLTKLPTLAVIGTGLIPALIAFWMLRRPLRTLG